MNCFRCGNEVPVEGRVMRKDECPSCHSSLHCCRNCDLHDRSAHNQCREPAAEWVSNREAANFCEFFQPGSGGNGGSSPEDPRSAFDRLFK